MGPYKYETSTGRERRTRNRGMEQYARGRGDRRKSGHGGEKGKKEAKGKIRHDPGKGSRRTRRVEKRKQRMQKKRVTVCYRLQMTAITRTGAGEVADEVDDGGYILSQKLGDVGRVVKR